MTEAGDLRKALKSPPAGRPGSMKLPAMHTSCPGRGTDGQSVTEESGTPSPAATSASIPGLNESQSLMSSVMNSRGERPSRAETAPLTSTTLSPGRNRVWVGWGGVVE